MLNLYTKVLGLLFRTKAWLKSDRRYPRFKQLYREQYLSSGELEILQSEKLRKMVLHAVAESPYYRTRYGEAGVLPIEDFSLSDLPRLPLLTREDLQDNLHEILCTDFGPYYPDSSGGSTGHPVNFFHGDTYEAFSDACELLFLSWMDVAPGDRTAVFWGADRDFEQLSIKERLMEKIERTKCLNSFNVTDDSLVDFLRMLDSFEPTYIIGYASSLYLAAKQINASDEYCIRPRAVRSAAEKLFESQREEIERAFDTRLFDFYGSREVSHLAAECPEHKGLHVFASGRIIEVVDEQGQPLPAGQMGRLAVTDLTNFAFPFIRYINGDMGTASAETCACGRGYPLLESIVGRSSDIIYLNGKHIHGEYFTHLFYGRPEVKQFQVVQETADSLRIKIVAQRPDFDSGEIQRMVREAVGPNITIEVELVPSIPPSKSGKYRFTINNLTNHE